jgi:arylsulfatase A-like enzyme
MLGKWHLKSAPTGFDHWMILKGQGTYYNPRFLTKEGKVRLHGYTTDIITDLAIDWLKQKRDKSKPFCLMVQHKAPHRNWRPGPDHIKDFDGENIPEPEDLFDDWKGLGPAAKTQTMTVAKHLNPHDLKLVRQRGLDPAQRKIWDTAYGPKNEAYKRLVREGKLQGKALIRWKYQRYIKDYLRCIASVDDGVGRLLDSLRDQGLLENTVVIYSSDQGFFLGDHGWFDKRWFYEESARMPLLVSWPKAFPKGKSIDALVQNLDFAPTFLQLAGCDIPADMQGKSLVPLLRKAGAPSPQNWRKSIYYHYYEFPGSHSVRKHEGVRSIRYKLIHYYTLPFFELFDLEKDPGEHHNLYEDPSYRNLREKLKAELQKLRKQYRVPEPR